MTKVDFTTNYTPIRTFSGDVMYIHSEDYESEKQKYLVAKKNRDDVAMKYLESGWITDYEHDKLKSQRKQYWADKLA